MEPSNESLKSAVHNVLIEAPESVISHSVYCRRSADGSGESHVKVSSLKLCLQVSSLELFMV